MEVQNKCKLYVYKDSIIYLLQEIKKNGPALSGDAAQWQPQQEGVRGASANESYTRDDGR